MLYWVSLINIWSIFICLLSFIYSFFFGLPGPFFCWISSFFSSIIFLMNSFCSSISKAISKSFVCSLFAFAIANLSFSINAYTSEVFIFSPSLFLFASMSLSTKKFTVSTHVSFISSHFFFVFISFIVNIIICSFMSLMFLFISLSSLSW